MLDHIGALIEYHSDNSYYRKGVLTVVVFKISPSKKFSPPPQCSQPPPRSRIARYALALGLNFEDLGS